MPFPVLIGGIAIGGLAVAGVYEAYRGASRMRQAKRIGESAQRRCESAVQDLDSKRSHTFQVATLYGERIDEYRTSTVQKLAEFLTALQKRPGMGSIPLPADVEVDLGTLEEYRARVLDAPKDLLGAASALTAGAAAGASAVALVGLFGTASTGTAIASLSGAAATNATMAWLGGGSLAAGGSGMAGGAIVLGGIYVAPVLLVTGFVIASKGEKMLTESRAYEAGVEKQVATILELETVLGQIEVRIGELMDVLSALNERAENALKELDAYTFSMESDRDMGNLTIALQMVKAMTEVMRTPVLVDGELSDESRRVVVKYRSAEED